MVISQTPKHCAPVFMTLKNDRSIEAISLIIHYVHRIELTKRPTAFAIGLFVGKMREE